MTLALVTAISLAIIAPHLLRLDHVTPAAGATIWLSALALRALTTLLAVTFVVFWLPATELFYALTHWCWHAVVPLVSTHLFLDGHAVADAAILLPTMGASASLVAVAFGVARAALAVRRWLGRAARPGGPQDSLVVGDDRVLVAAAGLARPRVVVSLGALMTFEADELAASLEHERGHIARRHRYVLVVAELCRALARVLPGTRPAMVELRFHLERDADAWAVARRHDGRALASAICKAAGALPAAGPAAAALDGGGTTRRVGQLLQGHDSSAWRRAVGVALALAMVGLTVALAAIVPATARAGITQAEARPAIPEHCRS
ncbi:MAG: M56 family metallopeptidase [Solirubrobacteraceae bacterium MAG38_C4-C5]|nr:M56 family metallopeptidase [Candidatus Siliceabacter maunaloa]